MFFTNKVTREIIHGPREPNLVRIAYASSESRGTFRQKNRSLAPLNGWTCAVEICHDGMLEDTNSLDGAQIIHIAVEHELPLLMYKIQTKPGEKNEPRQANLCLRAFRHDKF